MIDRIYNVNSDMLSYAAHLRRGNLSQPENAKWVRILVLTHRQYDQQMLCC